MFYVKKGSFDLLKKLVIKNLNHEHDLMHKANGWLLREMGKKDEQELLDFLKMPVIKTLLKNSCGCNLLLCKICNKKTGVSRFFYFQSTID